jgi:hypothetical protein
MTNMQPLNPSDATPAKKSMSSSKMIQNRTRDFTFDVLSAISSTSTSWLCLYFAGTREHSDRAAVYLVPPSFSEAGVDDLLRKTRVSMYRDNCSHTPLPVRSRIWKVAMICPATRSGIGC